MGTTTIIHDTIGMLNSSLNILPFQSHLNCGNILFCKLKANTLKSENAPVIEDRNSHTWSSVNCKKKNIVQKKQISKPSCYTWETW